jgi:N-acetylmuramoyl-L-alanine amidase
VNGREVRVNGVNVWLSLPVTVSGGKPFVSSLDARTTLQPLVQPARNKSGQKVALVCLDPGHGGRQPGNQVGDRAEKTYSLLLARKVRSLLREAGLKVVMTRDSDSYVDLDERPDFARRRKADLFVSLHYNATPQSSDSARGVEVYCLTPAGVLSTNSRGDDGTSTQAYPGNLENQRSILLAYEIQKALVSNLSANDRGVRRARFAVLRPATMPAVLVEAGFMTDPEDAKDIWNDKSRGDQARAIVDGILAYKRLVER